MYKRSKSPGCLGIFQVFDILQIYSQDTYASFTYSDQSEVTVTVLTFQPQMEQQQNKCRQGMHIPQILNYISNTKVTAINPFKAFQMTFRANKYFSPLNLYSDLIQHYKITHIKSSHILYMMYHYMMYMMIYIWQRFLCC